MKRFFKKKWIALLAFIGSTQAVVAQDIASNSSFDTMMDKVNKSVKSAGGKLITLFMYIALISTAVSFIWAMVDRKQGQEGANQKAINVMIGSLIVFAGLFIVKTMIGK